jgi:hypothetical protein
MYQERRCVMLASCQIFPQHQVEASGGLVFLFSRTDLDKNSYFLCQEQRCVMLASRQIFPVVSIKWRPQEDLSSLSAEQALITFLLPVSGGARCDAGCTPDLPRGRHQAEATGGLVLLVSRTGLDNIPIFCIRRGAV